MKDNGEHQDGSRLEQEVTHSEFKCNKNVSTNSNNEEKKPLCQHTNPNKETHHVVFSRWSVSSSSSSSAVYMNDWCRCCVQAVDIISQEYWRRLYSSSKFQQGNQELILGNVCHRSRPSLPHFLRHFDHLVKPTQYVKPYHSNSM